VQRLLHFAANEPFDEGPDGRRRRIEEFGRAALEVRVFGPTLMHQ
jgi:hypothetical protein